MTFKSLFNQFKHILFLLRKKGIRYTYNYLHFALLFDTKNPLLIKLLYWLKPYPSYIEIEVTTRCNLECIICEHTYWKEKNRDISFKEFKNIVDQFPKLKWIGLTGIGESFLNKDFLKMLRYVKEKNIFVELYENFYLIDENIARELVEMEIDKILVSFDAATKETYEKIRVNSNFERVIKNVKNLLRLKKEKRAYFPEIAFHFIINKLNISEISQYIDLVHSITQGEKTTIQFTRMLHKFSEINNLFTEVPENIIQDTERKAKEIKNIEITWNTDVPRFKPSLDKCTKWTMPFIFVTGHVIPCCVGNEANRRDFQKETALGNVFEQNFKEIWYGEKYEILRKMLRQGKVPLACKNCSVYETKR